MSEISENKPAIWFWIVSGLGFVWNLMGVGAYVTQQTSPESYLAEMNEAQIAAFEALPAWYTGVFAIAVFAGAIGCLLLLLRKKWAFHALVLSLLAVIIQQIYIRFMSDAMASIAPSEKIMFVLIPLVGIFLVWFARLMTGKGVLK